MRIAIISDIHGNLQSLEQVLADIENAGVDQTICLGDVASLGPQPREVIARLRDLHIPTVMGNHDNYLLNPELTADHHPWLRTAELWCVGQLTPQDTEFLRSFQHSIRLEPGPGIEILFFHGSPRSNEEFLYPNVPPAILNEILDGRTEKILIGGHTHVQMVRQHKDATLMNPGSVGMPFKFPPPNGQEQHALKRTEYAILDLTDNRISFDLRQLPIDFPSMERSARASGLPDVEFWLETWQA